MTSVDKNKGSNEKTLGRRVLEAAADLAGTFARALREVRKGVHDAGVTLSGEEPGSETHDLEGPEAQAFMSDAECPVPDGGAVGVVVEAVPKAVTGVLEEMTVLQQPTADSSGAGRTKRPKGRGRRSKNPVLKRPGSPSDEPTSAGETGEGLSTVDNFEQVARQLLEKFDKYSFDVRRLIATYPNCEFPKASRGENFIIFLEDFFNASSPVFFKLRGLMEQRQNKFYQEYMDGLAQNSTDEQLRVMAARHLNASFVNETKEDFVWAMGENYIPVFEQMMSKLKRGSVTRKIREKLRDMSPDQRKKYFAEQVNNALPKFLESMSREELVSMATQALRRRTEKHFNDRRGAVDRAVKGHGKLGSRPEDAVFSKEEIMRFTVMLSQLFAEPRSQIREFFKKRADGLENDLECRKGIKILATGQAKESIVNTFRECAECSPTLAGKVSNLFKVKGQVEFGFWEIELPNGGFVDLSEESIEFFLYCNNEKERLESGQAYEGEARIDRNLIVSISGINTRHRWVNNGFAFLFEELRERINAAVAPDLERK